MQRYAEQSGADPSMKMIDLEHFIPGIKTDIRYATKNNFTGELIYTSAKAFARKPVAHALKAVQDSLSELGLGLLIFDAYRPYSATVKLFEIYPHPGFVADPAKGSRHNRGCAVDISLIQLKTGKELKMPTAFDDFSEKAHSKYMDLPAEAIKNRALLFGIMDHFGFDHLETEWWHFDFRGWEKFPLMDISFESLAVRD
ncbi:MAG TPA: peptidase M15 [Saprospirales bacterium]|nr:peptidase M15 [Saprospirales bacterium]